MHISRKSISFGRASPSAIRGPSLPTNFGVPAHPLSDLSPYLPNSVCRRIRYPRPNFTRQPGHDGSGAPTPATAPTPTSAPLPAPTPAPTPTRLSTHPSISKANPTPPTTTTTSVDPSGPSSSGRWVWDDGANIHNRYDGTNLFRCVTFASMRNHCARNGLDAGTVDSVTGGA